MRRALSIIGLIGLVTIITTSVFGLGTIAYSIGIIQDKGWDCFWNEEVKL